MFTGKNMLNKINIDNEQKMKICLQVFHENLSNIRIGRATPELLNNIYIEYFGSKTSLRKVSNIIVEDSHTLKINVFDNSVTSLIKKSILNAKLDLNPIVNGKDIIIQIPPLTEDRRKNIIKSIRNDAENTRICIRNIRRDSNEKLKKLIKNKIISKDEEYIAQNKIQKTTDQYIKKVESILLKKEAELMKF